MNRDSRTQHGRPHQYMKRSGRVDCATRGDGISSSGRPGGREGATPMEVKIIINEAGTGRQAHDHRGRRGNHSPARRGPAQRPTAGAASSVNSSSCPMAASRSSAGVGRTAAGVGRTAAGALNAITKAVAGDGPIETNSSIHSPAAKPGAPVAASSGRSPMPLRRPISTKPKA